MQLADPGAPVRLDDTGREEDAGDPAGRPDPRVFEDDLDRRHPVRRRRGESRAGFGRNPFEQGRGEGLNLPSCRQQA